MAPKHLNFVIKVTPRSTSNVIGETFADAQGRPVLSVAVQAAPESGKANVQVIKLLAQHLGIPQKQIQIVRGHTAHIKQIRILAPSPQQCESVQALLHITKKD